MRLAVISFTERGGRLNGSLCRAFRERGHRADSFEKRRQAENGGACPETAAEGGGPELEKADGLPSPVAESLGEWTGRAFRLYDGLVFVGACGIAVRAVAPFLKDKFKDPAVVAVDEGAGFSVSLVSGHAGGANDLCLMTAEASGAVPVISTATDVNGLFAVDVFARQNGLFLSDRRLAKEVSAAVLSGKRIPFFSTQPLLGEPPAELAVLEREEEFLREPGLKIAVSERRLSQEGEILYLVPGTVTAGMGCRKGARKEALREALADGLSEAGIFPEALAGIATIEDKKEEEGLIRLAKELGVPFFWYAGQELSALSGEFSHSAFVEETVGVGCVCERAAVLGSGGGRLLLPKRAGGGVTVAAALGRKKLVFGREKERG